jgi:hypothetical protein
VVLITLVGMILAGALLYRFLERCCENRHPHPLAVTPRSRAV